MKTKVFKLAIDNELLVLFLVNIILVYSPLRINTVFVSINYLTLLFLCIFKFKPKVIDLFKYRMENIPFVLLLLYSISTVLFSSDIKNGVQQIIAFCMIFVLFFKIIYDKYDQKYLMVFIKSSFVINAIYVLILYLFKNQLSINMYGTIFVGFLNNSHNMGMVLADIFMLSVATMIIVKNVKYRILGVGVIFITLYLLFLTHSRAALASSTFYVLVILYNYLKTRKNIFYKIIIVVTFGVLVYKTIVIINEVVQSADPNINILARMFHRGIEGRTNMRNEILHFMITSKQFLWTGYGFGSINSYGLTIVESPKDCGSFVAILFEVGLIGLFLWIVIIFQYIRRVFYLMKKENEFIPLLVIPIPYILDVSSTEMINYSTFQTLLILFLIAATFKFYDSCKGGHVIENR